MKTYGLWINGQERNASDNATQEVLNPYNNEVIAKIAMATIEDLDEAIDSAQTAFETVISKMPAYERGQILKRSSELLYERAEEFAQTICLEAGKPIKASRGEVKRVAQFLEACGESAKRIKGEVLPMDQFQGGENRFGMTIRVPIGVVGAIGAI